MLPTKRGLLMDLAKELNIKTAEAQSLEEQIKALDERIAQLSVARRAKEKEKHAAAIAALKDRFADVNPALALIGAKSPHEAKLFGSSYFLSLPAGEITRAVEKFTLDPVVVAKRADGTDHKEDFGPITPHEQVLLQWLVALQAPPEAGGQKRELSALPFPQRIKMIRTLPTALLQRLATESENLFTYLTLVMETELGNF